LDQPLVPAVPLPASLADEVVLLLATEGIEARIVPADRGVSVVVASAHLARAQGIVAEEYPEGLAAAAVRRLARDRERTTAATEARDRWFGRGAWVLGFLVLLCTALFIGEERSGGSEHRAVLLRFGASRPAHVRTGEWWRLVTALFVHIGPRHLLANMATLLVLGPALTAALGAGRFALVYLLSGAAGNAVSYLVTSPDVVSAGASGAILGVLGALGGQRLRFAASARFRGWQVVAALLAYLAIAVGAEPGVDTMAHMGGLGAGLMLGLVIPPEPRAPSTGDQLLSALCGAAALAILATAYTGLFGALP